MSCVTLTCGIGDWTGPLPGDPDNNSVLQATPSFGGIDVTWTFPTENPQAVAHTLLYRNINNDFSSATQIAVVAGNVFYDRHQNDTSTRYYYWIQIVSVHGTVGATIGPASAIAKASIEDYITLLTGKIDQSLLAQALRTDIARIGALEGDLSEEAAYRLQSNQALAAALQGVQTEMGQALTLLQTEVTQRTNGDEALVQIMDTMAAGMDGNSAAIIEERTARVNADEALAQTISTLYVKNEDFVAAIQNEARVRADGDSSLAQQIQTTQSTLGQNIASVQQTMQTNINTVDGKVTNIGARWTAVLSVNGLVGGFGVYNTGQQITAGFDVDQFWIGRAGTLRKPFIVDGGLVYIDEAVIRALTFNKLRSDDGSLVFENGKLKAQYITAERLMGGSFTQYGWPAGGNTGFYLGPEGLMMGNFNTGKYFQVVSNGDVYMPGFRVVNGETFIDGAKIERLTVKTLALQGEAATAARYTTGGTGLAISVALGPDDGTSQFQVIAMGFIKAFGPDLTAGDNGVSEKMYLSTGLYIDGAQVAFAEQKGWGNIAVSVMGGYASWGNRSVGIQLLGSSQGPANGVIQNLVVFISKR